MKPEKDEEMRDKPLLGLVLSLSLCVAAIPALAQSPGHQTLPSDPVAASDSIYLLDGTFVDQQGKEVGLDVYEGHPVMISMFYATCPHACPMLIADMKRIEKALSEEQRQDLRVILITFDPDRDTVEKMRALFDAHQLDPNRWKMLRTDPAKVQEVAAVLGTKYRFAADGNINHSSTISLLDHKGVVVERLEGLRQPEGPIVQRIAKMEAAPKGK